MIVHPTKAKPAKRDPQNPKRLLVEGREKFVIPELLEKSGIDWDDATYGTPVYINPLDGRKNFFVDGVIETQAKLPGLTHLGLIIDADDSAVEAWGKLSRTWKKFVDLPESLPRDGWIGKSRTPRPFRVGVWIMPDNGLSQHEPGRHLMIETFFHRLIPPVAAPLWEFAQEMTREAKLPPRNAPYKSVQFDKAVLATWLAWQEAPGEQLHIAAKSSAIFRVDDVIRLRFVRWFRDLFEISASRLGDDSVFS